MTLTDTPPPVGVPDARACIVSRSVLDKSSALRWLWRAEPIEPPDTGWRLIADEPQAVINNPDNLTTADLNTVAAIEPAILAVHHLPVGTELELRRDGRRITIVDARTGVPVVS